MTHPMLDFLNDALTEQERTALDAGPRHADSADLYVLDDDAYYPLIVGPKLVLVTVAAFRATLALHEDDGRGYCSVPCMNWGWIEAPAYEEWPCETVRHLGAAFKHRDGYLPEWAPT
jgi:hypothetical protein